MRTSWEALGARARGLGTHLLSEERVGSLGRVESLSDFVKGLHDTPYAGHMPPGAADAAAIEAGVARSLAERMATLTRWAGPGARVLVPVLLDQDMRNIRAVLRGVLGELTPVQRLAGAIATPTLGRRALETLSRAESAGAVAASLVAWRHPAGSTIFAEARRGRPDLMRLEAALGRWWVDEAARVAPQGGGAMRRFVAETVDAYNVVAALLLAGARSEGAAERFFVDGGTCLDRRGFVRGAASPDRVACAEVLARATRRTLFEEPLRSSPVTPAALSARILDRRIEEAARSARRDPLTALPVLLFVLRLRREARLVRRALWGAALAGGGGR